MHLPQTSVALAEFGYPVKVRWFASSQRLLTDYTSVE
jgi:hypothetical protein